MSKEHKKSWYKNDQPADGPKAANPSDQPSQKDDRGSFEEDKEACCQDEGKPSEDGCCSEELNALNAKLEERARQCDEYKDALQRMAAEYDNYKKRTTREKEALYSEAVSDTITAFLTVLDNMDRAYQAIEKSSDQSLKEGIELVFRQFKDVMKNLNVEEIKDVGESFDPNLHNAVMHIEDEVFGPNQVAEVFLKGYKLKEKVIRHSMVKVAN